MKKVNFLRTVVTCFIASVVVGVISENISAGSFAVAAISTDVGFFIGAIYAVIEEYRQGLNDEY